MNFSNPTLTNAYLTGQESALYYDTKRGPVYTSNVGLSILGNKTFEVSPFSNTNNKKTNQRKDFEKPLEMPVKVKHTRTLKPVPEERRCSATCLSGERCSLQRQVESDYCRIHENKFNPKEKPIKTEEISIKDTDTSKCIGKGCTIMGGSRRRIKKSSRRRIKKNKKHTIKSSRV